jgi:hypothetical protein
MKENPMRFLSVYKAEERNEPPSEKLINDMGQLISEMMAAGVLIATEGCQPTAKGARVRRTGGKYSVIDGPFAESKEVIAGFALLEAASLQEAVAFSQKFLDVAGDGECEIRLLHAEPGA